LPFGDTLQKEKNEEIFAFGGVSPKRKRPEDMILSSSLVLYII